MEVDDVEEKEKKEGEEEEGKKKEKRGCGESQGQRLSGRNKMGVLVMTKVCIHPGQQGK